jgi:hypothetical protein
MILKTSEPIRALENPSTLNPGVNALTIINMNAFIININNPKLKIVIGRLIRMSNGLINIFTKPMITTAINADVKSES